MTLESLVSSNVKVSVLIVTYNHELFIAQAIESALMQETDFTYDIVIGEDCSSDHTREIVTDYVRRFPHRIRLLLREENMGGVKNFLDAIQVCGGQYVALLEGDDYWMDPYKLQKQVDFLDTHPDYSICSHNIKLADNTELTDNEWLGREHPTELTIEDLLSKGSGGATCSLVFRKAAFIPFPDWYARQQGGDWSLQILCASKGKMRYFPEVMGVYRRHSRGSLYQAEIDARSRGEDAIALPTKGCLILCDVLDEHFNFRYTRLINRQRVYWSLLGAKEYASVNTLKSAQYILKTLSYTSLLEMQRNKTVWSDVKQLIHELFVAKIERLRLLLRKIY